MYKDIENKLGLEIEQTTILNSGWAGEIISLKLKDNMQKYIVKTYSSSKNGLENIKQEWAGLNILYKANYPVPKPVMINDSTNIPPYIVMEEIKGENFWTYYLNLANENKEQLLYEFTRLFFELHELDTSIVNNSQTKYSTASFIEEEINNIKKLIEENNLKCFNDVLHWLQFEKTNIMNHTLSIIHRDFHPWNVIVDITGKLYVIDLLWGIGDYRFDLAWTCTLMERSGFKDFSDNIFNKYQSLKKENISNFEYFKVLSTLRWLVNVVISLKTGDNLNETRNAEFENFISPLIQKGVQLIKEIACIQIII
ncbi:aminoglycoside phosphotransferase family protein [Clostridium sp.]|uniref:phosphotransferase family protein n=1 Tax=Clostridium sp. TaxID=1506 RepID=UPI00283BAD18|nr:aminoglycoside phosphotransferase family protein [Clostridium sp.]MDR3598348.1 aminoglycoside phosphotransferase family protein [Clostridium sp.]